MRIRRLRKITYITITAAIEGYKEYVGESFEAVFSEDGETITGFKDWLNGGDANGYIIDFTNFSYEVSGEGLDITTFNQAFAETTNQVVLNRLWQKLFIQYNELKYTFLNTVGKGVPYINKKTKAEMDLILKDKIVTTEGVEKIEEFISSVDDNRHYTAQFKVKTIKGEVIWLTIDQ